MARVLHIGDIAGQSSMMAHFEFENKHKVLALLKDPFEIAKYYGIVDSITDSRWRFKLMLIMSFLWCDMVWLNGITYNKKRHRWMRHVVKKPYVLHYHGSEVRRTPFEVRRIYEEGAGAIVVSSRSLLQHRYAREPVLLTRMVDTRMFYKMYDVPDTNDGICFLKDTQTIPETMDVLREYGYDKVDWRFIRRPGYMTHESDKQYNVITKAYKYGMMPQVLSNYKYCADISFEDGKLIRDWSLTGLQAMSMGCSTISYDGVVSDTLNRRYDAVLGRGKARRMIRRLLCLPP